MDYFVHNRNPFSKQLQKCETGRDFVKIITDFCSNKLGDSDGESGEHKLISISHGNIEVLVQVQVT